MVRVEAEAYDPYLKSKVVEETELEVVAQDDKKGEEMKSAVPSSPYEVKNL